MKLLNAMHSSDEKSHVVLTPRISLSFTSCGGWDLATRKSASQTCRSCVVRHPSLYCALLPTGTISPVVRNTLTSNQHRSSMWYVSIAENGSNITSSNVGDLLRRAM